MQITGSTRPQAGKDGRRVARWAALGFVVAMSGCGTDAVEAPRGGEAPPDVTVEETPAESVTSVDDATDPGGWKATVFARIAAGEYAIRAQGDALEAFNRQQGLRATFGAEGVRVRERAPESGVPVAVGETGLRLAAIAVSRGDERTELEARAFAQGACRKDGAVDEMGQCLRRAEVRHDGLVEWWENTPAGLEQGFDVQERPDGEGPLHIEIQVEAAGNRIDESGQSATFTLPGGQAVHYGKLLAKDATGRSLGIRLVPSAGGLAIEVDDAGAVYPLLVDPLLETSQYLSGTSQVGSSFGKCVGSAGDVNKDGFGDVIIGAPGHDGTFADGGKAYVFLGTATGLSSTSAWAQEGKSSASGFGCPSTGAGDVNGDGFGDVVVAAPNHDGAFVDGGAVYHYRGGASGLQTLEQVVIHGQAANARLGNQLVAAGDVDRDGYSDVVLTAGPYLQAIHRGSAQGLASAPYRRIDIAGELSAGDVDGDGYGDVVLVGSSPGPNSTTSYLVAGGPGAGGPTTLQTLQVGWLNSAKVVGDATGDGRADLAVCPILADFGPSGSVYATGAVQVLPGTATGFSTTEMVGVSRPAPCRVIPAGDVNGDGLADMATLAVPNTTPSGSTDWAFEVLAGSPTALVSLGAYPLGPGEAGAFTVGAAGDVNGDGYADVLLGNPTYDLPTTDQGRARLYLGAPAGLNAGPFSASTAVTATAAAHLGTSVAGVGDVNGDGYDDVGVAAEDYGGRGAAWVFGGTATGLTANAVWTEVGFTGDGVRIAGAGDVNGDGYADVLLSRPRSGDFNRGWAAVYLGNASTWVSSLQSVTFFGSQNSALFGDSIAAAGDVNGDGYADIAIGSPLFNADGFVDNGRVVVYRGDPSGAPVEMWVRTGTCDGGRFGQALASAGDRNGDGLDDLIVGSPFCGGGKVEVFSGHATTPLAAIGQVRSEAQAGARLGAKVAGAGDVNGDGYADVLAGAPLYDTPSADAGRVALYFGGPAALPDWVVVGDQSGAQLGAAVAGAGDVNADALGDLVVGAPFHDSGATDQGRVFVYHGGAGGPSATPSWTSPVPGTQTGAQLGASVAAAGDVNGDGYSEILIGAPMYDDGAVDSGKVWLQFSNRVSLSTDVGPRLRARRTASTTAILPRARTASVDGFDVAILRAKNPAGRSRVRMQYEIQPLGAAYTGTTLQNVAYVGVGLLGATVKSHANAAIGGTTPHFRARVLYEPSASPPWSQRSPWRYGGVLGDARGISVRLAP